MVTKTDNDDRWRNNKRKEPRCRRKEYEVKNGNGIYPNLKKLEQLSLIVCVSNFSETLEVKDLWRLSEIHVNVENL